MKHEIELQPFRTPNFVLPVQKPGSRQDGFHDAGSIPLSELSVETLEKMCAQFRIDVMTKAGKPI
jgi:hypothetical protein